MVDSDLQPDAPAPSAILPDDVDLEGMDEFDPTSGFPQWRWTTNPTPMQVQED